MQSPDTQTTVDTSPGRRVAIDRRNTYTQVADDVVDLLKKGDLRPGSPMMSERELTEIYGVGRSSAREALRVLEARGLIVGDDRGSFIVADPITTLNGAIELLLELHHGSVRDLFEVRRMIEVENAALAAQRRTDEQLQLMGTAMTEQLEASRAHSEGRGDIEAMMEADVRFHMVIAAASQNPLSLTIMEGIQRIMRGAQVAVGNIAGLADTSLREHRVILEAITAGAVDSARTAMREHLERVERDAERILDRQALNPLGS
jgi:GntR family transcriptional regulator, transcriptional repressor for pyruvate dehydrogenase complex